tara:strand:- start:288 stop:677 length:390 start_codon:yes stop_codon:yes gene_type:complete
MKKIPSNRSFGFIFSILFFILSIYLYIFNNSSYFNFFLIISLIIFLIAIFVPKILSPFNNIWNRFSILLSKIVNPIVLGIIFYLIITPIGIIAKLFGRDILKLRKNNVKSYWTDKEKIKYDKNSFKNQY